jgi:hypothetical protein
MQRKKSAAFAEKTIAALTIEDERSFRHVALYADLKEILRRDRYRFRILRGPAATWDRALFLNLTFWSPDAGGDILVSDRIAADVVTHVAWHHLAARALKGRAGAAPSVESLFLGEAIASAFDLYLVGRLLGHAPRSEFLATQIPAMSDAAESAGVTADEFAALLGAIAGDPDRAFSDLRALLFDASVALHACKTAEHAARTLATFDAHRFGPLLHRYELANWVLYARAYGRPVADRGARAVDRALRRKGLAWLTAEWVAPALEP